METGDAKGENTKPLCEIDMIHFFKEFFCVFIDEFSFWPSVRMVIGGFEISMMKDSKTMTFKCGLDHKSALIPI